MLLLCCRNAQVGHSGSPVETSDKKLTLEKKTRKVSERCIVSCVWQLSEKSKILEREPRRKAFGRKDGSCWAKSLVAMVNKVSEVLVSAQGVA